MYIAVIPKHVVHRYWSVLKYVVHLIKPKWTRVRNQIGNMGGLSSWPPIKYFPLWKWRWTLVLKDFLNPTSGRDASHSCLISLWPIKGIVRFGWQSLRHVRQHASPLQTACASSFWDLLYYTCVVVVHSSLGQRLIWHEWEASLPDVGLSKSLRTKTQNHFQRAQYLIGERFVPPTKRHLLMGGTNL